MQRQEKRGEKKKEGETEVKPIIVARAQKRGMNWETVIVLVWKKRGISATVNP